MVINSGLYERFSRERRDLSLLSERYIDDFLNVCLDEGLDQVVILGAGFDTRAYRIARDREDDECSKSISPPLRPAKLKRLKKIIDPLPEYVTLCPWISTPRHSRAPARQRL